jgi:hypothetical protein
MRGLGSLLMYVVLPVAVIATIAVLHGRHKDRKAAEAARQKQEKILASPILYAKEYVRTTIRKPAIDDEGRVFYQAHVWNNGPKKIRKITFRVTPLGGGKKRQKLDMTFGPVDAESELHCRREIDKVPSIGFASYSYQGLMTGIEL